MTTSASDKKHPSDSLPLLAYRFSTDPGPLQAGTVNTPTSARINIALSPGKNTIYCNEVILWIPIGEEGDAFSEKAPVASVNSTKWVIESSIEKKRSPVNDTLEINCAVYTFSTRDKADNLINYNLVLGITGFANDSAGQFVVTVKENSGTDPDLDKFTLKTAKFPLSKNTPEFYLKNFIATTLATPLLPCSEFANGADIRLSWESNGTWFKIFRKNDAKEIWEGPETNFTVLKGTPSNTTFILSACVIGKPDKDGVKNFQPIYLYDALAVTISNPDLTPRTIATSGNVVVNGALEVTGATKLHNTSVEGSYVVVGKSTMHDVSLEGTLNVVGKTLLHETRVESNLTVTGKTEVSDVEFKKAVTIPTATVNSLTAGALTVNSDATLKANTNTNNLSTAHLSVTESVSMIQAGGTGWIKPGKYTAHTDMMITANISANASGGCFGSVSIIAGGRRMNACGGNVLGPPWTTEYNSSGAVTCFVRKGEQYELIYQAHKGQPSFAFYCWSLGRYRDPQ